MTAQSDQELLHAAIDGALTGAEAERLRERLAEDAALRAEADRLKRLTGLVDLLGPSDLPESFSDRVMEEVARSHPELATRRWRVRARLDQLLGRVPGHLQQEATSGAVVRWNTGSAGGGDIVAKKALWAVAGLAVVIILGVVYFNGTRTVDQGAQGTIGGAERYRGTQPASVAVTEGDVQKFLQSDTFDRIIKDKNVRSLLGNHELCAQLASEEYTALVHKFKAALADPDAAMAVKRLQADAALDNAEAMTALGSVGVATALREDAVAMALKNGLVVQLLGDAGIQAELLKLSAALQAYADLAAKDSRVQLSANAELAAAMKRDANLRRLFGESDFQGLAKNLNGVRLITNDAFLRAMSGSGRALFSDPEFLTAMQRSMAAAELLSDGEFLTGIRGQLRSLVASDDYWAAVRNTDFAAELFDNNASLRNAMLNTALLDAALAKRQE
jgi:hypothetical protein